MRFYNSFYPLSEKPSSSRTIKPYFLQSAVHNLVDKCGKLPFIHTYPQLKSLVNEKVVIKITAIEKVIHNFYTPVHILSIFLQITPRLLYFQRTKSKTLSKITQTSVHNPWKFLAFLVRYRKNHWQIFLFWYNYMVFKILCTFSSTG